MKFQVEQYRSGGFLNLKPDMVRIYVEVPIDKKDDVLKQLQKFESTNSDLVQLLKEVSI